MNQLNIIHDCSPYRDTAFGDQSSLGSNLLPDTTLIIRSLEPVLACLKRPLQYIDIGQINEDKNTNIECLNESSTNLFIFSEQALTCHNTTNKVMAWLNKRPAAINLCMFFSQPPNPNWKLVNYFHDFLFWPCSAEEIEARIQRHAIMTDSNLSKIDQQLLENFAEHNLVGQSAAFIKVLALIKKVTQYNAPVLILGETGTGKENTARSTHYLSARRDFAFVPINCGAIPDDLIESELFGHERGAFTDAKTKQAGLVEIANGGSLFLDEVDCLSPKAQTTLLRFLQTQEYRPLGSRTIHQANVRVLAATNANLQQLVDKGQFREDLLFRLNVLNITMPPLRDRPEDIAMIAMHLINGFSQEYKTEKKHLLQPAIKWLINQPWPGNVRELENYLLREFLLSDESDILSVNIDGQNNDSDYSAQWNTEINDTDSDQTQSLSFQEAKAVAVNKFERRYIQSVLSRTHGNVTEAARIAGKERRALGKLIKKYSIDKDDFLVNFA